MARRQHKQKNHEVYSLRPAQRAKSGLYYVGLSEELLSSRIFRKYSGKINLILTSPPFPLNAKKSYGNLQGEEYVEWIKRLAPLLEELLAPDGSLVIEIGNCWEPGRPIQSLLPLKSLFALTSRSEVGGLRLIQEFICYNPSRLPSPAQWVTVKRLRAVDSFTHVWWLAKSDEPRADNSHVLRPYSRAMNDLLKRGTFNHGKRPSQHNIREHGFRKEQKGAIAHSFMELEPLDPDRDVRLPNALSMSNTISNDYFARSCEKQKITPHPARMPVGLAAFFIMFLTKEGDYILDPFAGSNTTGFAAALLGRNWIAIDAEKRYVRQSRIRFLDPRLKIGESVR